MSSRQRLDDVIQPLLLVAVLLHTLYSFTWSVMFLSDLSCKHFSTHSSLSCTNLSLSLVHSLLFVPANALELLLRSWTLQILNPEGIKRFLSLKPFTHLSGLDDRCWPKSVQSRYWRVIFLPKHNPRYFIEVFVDMIGAH